MSSSISADYSPTSNYSYPTDISLSPSSPAARFRPQFDQQQPPRLSSPHIFRDIFAQEGAAGPSVRSPPRLPPLHEINFNETMQDVNRALQSANRAIQTAQEAFQSRRMPSTNSSRRQDIVDLTDDSPPAPSRNEHSVDSFLTRTLHPHDSRSVNRMANSPLNEPIYPRTMVPASSLFVEEDDPTSRYAGQSDSLAGPRRRLEAQVPRRRSYITIPNMERTLLRSGFADTRRHEEEEAIRRQRVAREQWEQNQQRQQQRERLQQQRDRIMARSQSDRNRAADQQLPSSPFHPNANSPPAGVSLDSGSSPPRPASSHSTSSSSSVETVDLTSVNNTTDLAAALIQSQSAEIAAKAANSLIQPRSALTGYKCPICLEPPRNATSTVCGHLFCHECIIETLKNSENLRREDAPPQRKVKGQCPVCRKELTRKDEEGNGRTLVPLQIKLISKEKMEEMRHQERKRQRSLEKNSKGKGNDKGNGKGKGKGKEKLDTNIDADVIPDGNRDQQIFDLSSDDEYWGISSSSQKENKAKRVKLSKSEELDQELFGAFTYEEEK